MKVVFDADARIAGIGLVPWTRLGPERWLKNYVIASLYGWSMADLEGAPKVFSLAGSNGSAPNLPRLNSQRLLNEPSFQALLLNNLRGYAFAAYKPVLPPRRLLDAGYTFLQVDQKLAKLFENKAEFRSMFGDKLPFSKFTVLDRGLIKPDARGLASVLAGRDVVVVQDEWLSGGKGTYVVRDVKDLRQALAAYAVLGGGKRVVVSDYIQDAHERSVQCVITRYGVFVGPLQKQIIRHPLLSNPAIAEGGRFCGGELSAQDSLRDAYEPIRSNALLVGNKLRESGYRGIFGMDFLVQDNGRVFVLEVNPRITGMTPLLTMLYRDGHDIPFYLLHLLELADVPYEITDTNIDPIPPEGSLMVLYSRLMSSGYITDFPESGSYDLNGHIIKKCYRIEMNSAEPRALLQQYTPPNIGFKPGGRLAMLYVNRPVYNSRDEFTPEALHLVTTLLDRIKLRSKDV